MSERRVPRAAGSPSASRPSLIHYPKPDGFVEPTGSSPSAAAQPPQHRRLESDLYPVADADAGQAESSVSGQQLDMDEIDEEAEDSQHHDHDQPEEGEVVEQKEGEVATIDGPASPSATGAPKEQSKGAKMMDEFSSGAMTVLRGRVDNSPMVEDAILETMDFDNDEDYVNEDFMETRTPIHGHITLLLQFLLTVGIAFVTAMFMYGVSNAVDKLFEWKIDTVLELIEYDEGSASAAGGYFALLFISLMFVMTGALLCATIAPNARGGGVPYVLAYLNGTNVVEYFSWRIVGIKTVTLIFTIAGGLPLGMEGPFVFIGGGIAAIMNHATDYIFPFFSRHSSYSKILRSIREERIFISGGVAAGLAVAFDAPIAGVLFALEGSTAFLSAPVLVRIFGCAMFAAFFNNLGHTNFSAYIKNHNLLGVSNSGTVSEYAWTLLEVFPFLFIGVFGGIAGSFATKLNMKVSRWRHHHMQGNTWKDVGKQVCEIGLFCLVTITCWFVLPYIYGCRDKHALCDVEVAMLPVRCRQAHCEEGQYSEIGTIVYSTANQIAALLFDRSLEWSMEFHALPLITYGLIYWSLVSTIYGAYVPGGLFVPSIVVGGVYGRVVGIAVKAMFLTSSVNPGVYSLLGAASMLGGFTRLALPVVIMLVELTGDATYLLPMMFVSVVGKFVSDYLEPPLYPQHMVLEKIPSLTDKLNPVISKLTAKDIMLPADKCRTMATVERLSTVKEVLSQSKRVVFPLISPSGGFAGLILTRNVMFCLTDAPTYSTYEEALNQVQGDHGDAIRAVQKNSKSVDRHDKRDYSATITRGAAEIEDLWINLAPYMDAGCMTARLQTPAKRLAALFRRVGLSHLCITDNNNVFRGLITRRSLITPPGAQPAAHGHGHGAPAAAAHGDDHDDDHGGAHHERVASVHEDEHEMAEPADASVDHTPPPPMELPLSPMRATLSGQPPAQKTPVRLSSR